MSFIKKPFYIISIAILLYVSPGTGAGYAAEDGFVSARKIDGKNVIVYFSPDTDVPALMRQLDVRLADSIIAGKSIIKSANPPDSQLADMLDTLFMQVSDIMDMHIYSLQVNIKICRDDVELEHIYNRLSGLELKDRKSFFMADSNTIYISTNSFKKEILGHEMAHAIISRYFVIPPPVKIQEILAMYVEYCLRKVK